MSFTVCRVYNIIAGKDYNPATNGNVVLKFRASVTAGFLTVTGVGANVMARIAAIIAATGVPVITGPGVKGTTTSYDLVDTTTIPFPITPTSFDLINPAAITGTFEFKLFDSTIPSTEDSPVQAIHVLAGGNLNFRTLQGDVLTFASTNLIAGGVYYYGVGLVSNLGGGTYYGLAPNSKPQYIM